jgi:hypothetical protein
MTSHDRATWQIRATVSALIVWSMLMLWLCWSYGIRHDYYSYLGQWRLVLDGADPYSTDNTYGPLHIVIGLLLPWGDLVPKFFIVGALLAANAALVLGLIRERGIDPIGLVYVLAIPTNVLAVGVGVVYGLNDAFVAALLVFAVLLRHRGRLVAAGLLVGLAALTKYYPLMLLPFFALDGRRLRWSVIVSGMVVFCLGLEAAVAVWGHGPIDGILYNSRRGPTLLSILASLKAVFGGDDVVRWLIRYNTYFVVSGVAAAFVFAWTQRLAWLEGIVLGCLVMLIVYKVGYQQYYVPWLFLVAALPLLARPSADRMAIILLPAVLLLSLYHYGYDFGPDGRLRLLGWVRSYGGFMAFSVGAASIAACMIDRCRQRRPFVGEPRPLSTTSVASTPKKAKSAT